MDIPLRLFNLQNLPARVLFAPALVSGMQALRSRDADIALFNVANPAALGTEALQAARTARLKLSAWQETFIGMFPEIDIHRDEMHWSLVWRPEGGTCFMAPLDGERVLADRQRSLPYSANHALRTRAVAGLSVLPPGIGAVFTDRILHASPFEHPAMPAVSGAIQIGRFGIPANTL